MEGEREGGGERERERQALDYSYRCCATTEIRSEYCVELEEARFILKNVGIDFFGP